MSLESYYRGELERERDKVEKLRDAIIETLSGTWPGTYLALREVLVETEPEQALADTEAK